MNIQMNEPHAIGICDNIIEIFLRKNKVTW